MLYPKDQKLKLNSVNNMRERLKEIFSGISDEWIDRFVLDLTVYQDRSISLQTMAGSLYNDSVDHEAGIPGIREKTLTYLYPLLKEGKLVAGRIIGFDSNDPTATAQIADDGYLYENVPGTADEVMDYIRQGWATESKIFEMFGCVFKLPEMEWPRIAN